MAEARAVEALFGSVRNVELQNHDYGWTFNLRVTIPRPSVAGELLHKYARKFVIWLADLFYPIGLVAALLFVAGFMATVLLADENSWWRQGWLATVVWEISEAFPSLIWLGMPLMARIGILAGWVGLLFALGAAILNQICLRLLLGWHGYMYIPAKKATFAMKAWGAAVKILTGQLLPATIRRIPKLYSFARVMPALPVPDLESTVNKYVDSVKPLLNEMQFERVQLQARAFLAQEGPKLQRYLWFKWLVSPNYVTDWWEKYVYLRGRSSLQINSNYYCIDYERVPTKNRQARAAMVLRQFLEYKHRADDQAMEPMMVRGTVPLCMEQHLRMFSTTRVPGRESDTNVHLDGIDEKRHVVVQCKGTYYRLDCYQSGPIVSQATLLTAKQLEHRLSIIATDADDTARGLTNKATGRISSLTTMDRTRWAELREDHLSFGLNRVSLSVIETAIMVVVLSDEKPSNNADMGKLLLSGSNIWYDKSMNLMAFDNGRIGLNAEHSWADALVIAHLFETCIFTDASPDLGAGYDETGSCKPSDGEPVDPTLPPDPTEKYYLNRYIPQRLLWDIHEKGVLGKAISEAHDASRAASLNTELVIMAFKKFGKGKIKKMQMSPDSVIQMALQLAFYRDQDQRFGLTYEASMTRLFRGGRTETIRSLSEMSCNFVKTFEDSSVSAEERWAALQLAVTHHVVAAKDAMTGKGVDRHLFALYVVASGMNVESEFLKAAISQPWVLSTSQQPQRQVTKGWNPDDPAIEYRLALGGGFGPVADDGYGVSYMVAGDKTVFFHISSKKDKENTSSRRFAEALSKALEDISALHDLISAREPQIDEIKKGK